MCKALLVCLFVCLFGLLRQSVTVKFCCMGNLSVTVYLRVCSIGVLIFL